MTPTGLLALFAAMAVLAAVPSVSVLAVVARTTAWGLPHGILAAMGIVAGDVVFIVAALVGLALLAEAMGPAFVAIRILGGALLIVLGVLQWRAHGRVGGQAAPQGASPFSSFLAGLLITLGDQKAVIFYLGFLPAFLDPAAATAADIAAVAAVAVCAVGGVKVGYAFVAHRLGGRIGARAGRIANVVAAAVMVAVGVFLVATALS